MNVLRTLSVFALLAIFASNSQPALALSISEVIVMQSTLKQHGFDVGELDGRVGPATRRALRAFADEYGAPSDIEGAMVFMIQESVRGRKDVTSEAELEYIQENVAESMRDPSSTRIRNVYKVVSFETTFICGEVNGRNAYGGFAGFAAFYALDSPLINTFNLLKIDSGELHLAKLFCLYSFPKKSSD